MADKTDIPEWAWGRADRVALEQVRGDRMATSGGYREAFARYIAAHEEPPVDPLLIEAREINAQRVEQGVASGRHTKSCLRDADAFRTGRLDKTVGVEAAYAALKRGMELAKEK